MSRRILHLLSQRPSHTGSGVTLGSMVELADDAGWEQAVVVGTPADDPSPEIEPLAAERIHPVRFSPARTDAPADLAFPVPGMSDVMPYPSSVWSRLSSTQLQEYREVWQNHVARVVAEFRPDLIHTNHIWLMSSLVKSIAPDRPVVATCHATGLRQLSLCPQLAAEVAAGCRRIDRFCALRRDHRDRLAAALDIPRERIAMAGVGFRPEIFRTGADASRRQTEPDSLLYVGKFSPAKGLPSLLDAVEALANDRPRLRLHVAGGGAGADADQLRERMVNLAPLVRMHGQLDQPTLADLMRRCAVCVLPSFYEGVPLVLVEAAACGCRLVATDLPGVREQLTPHLGSMLNTVPLPLLQGVDVPDPAALPAFTTALAAALAHTLDTVRNEGPVTVPDLYRFTWRAVFARVEAVWKDLLGD